MTEWIEYRHIDKSYDDRPLIKDFNLTIEKGDFLCIVGTSGSGKTTLLKMINGLITPDRGEILIHGQPVSGGDLISLRRKIGYVIQGNGLFPHMSVAENIGYVLKLEHRDQAEIDAVVERLLRLVNLPESVKTKYPSELSGGQQQRVGIARFGESTGHFVNGRTFWGLGFDYALSTPTRVKSDSSRNGLHDCVYYP